MHQAYEGSPAEIYDRHFVPALFEQWGRVVADTAGLCSGMRVLDVACGTGALTCAARDRVGRLGEVIGLDINPEMLAVAGRKPVKVDWRQGAAEQLPFDDQSFDAVVSQFGFMFFDDRPAALREMMRVLRPGGRMSLAVCDALDHSPGYAVLAELLHRLFGQNVAEAFRAPFSCGDRALLALSCRQAGFDESQYQGLHIERHEGMVRFASIKDLVSTERACAWTLGGLLDEEQFNRLTTEAESSLCPFVETGGEVAFSMPVLILSAIKSS